MYYEFTSRWFEETFFNCVSGNYDSSDHDWDNAVEVEPPLDEALQLNGSHADKNFYDNLYDVVDNQLKERERARQAAAHALHLDHPLPPPHSPPHLSTHNDPVLLERFSSPDCQSCRDLSCTGHTVFDDPFDFSFAAQNGRTATQAFQNPQGPTHATTTLPPAYSNEVGPPLLLREMESIGTGGTLAAPSATLLPENPYTFDDLQSPAVTMPPVDHSPPASAPASRIDSGRLDPFNTPDPHRYMDHLTDSNVRESAEEHNVQTPATERQAAQAAKILVGHTTVHHAGGSSAIAPDHWTRTEILNAVQQNGSGFGHPDNDESSIDAFADENLDLSVPSEDGVDPEKGKGFAKLQFPDGDFIITTHDLMLGRDMKAFKAFKRECKQARKAQKAQAALDSYKKEPSQPSQPGDDDQQGHPSNSSRSLEGRPAPGLASNYSEQGGALHFPIDSDGEDEKRQWKKHRSLQQSSSTNSIAPASLHPSLLDFPQDFLDADGRPEHRTCALLPIHTHNPKDLKLLSKEHAMISFNFDKARWDLQVLGNGAFVNSEFFPRDSTTGLEHGDDIIVGTVPFQFQLPIDYDEKPGLRSGTFSTKSDDPLPDDESEAESELDAVSVRRSSQAEALDSEDEGLQSEANVGHAKKPKLKLSLKKTEQGGKGKKKDKQKPVRLHLKQQQEDLSTSPVMESAELVKKTDKGKKPKAASAESAQLVGSGNQLDVDAPVLPSMFEDIPADELPEKRKGPGRPPKNGIVSKRDHGFLKKRIAQYQARGDEVPPVKDLLDIIRKENKNKEILAKMIANGQEPPPEMQVVQSIETDTAPAPSRPAVASSSEAKVQTITAPVEPPKRASPRERRPAREPSPMPPESSYTEEQLKKPALTYVLLIDQILQEHPTGQMDLQQIYDRFQKKWPYFYYSQKTHGWQSSIRHNLQSSARFKENGRSGKGKIWAIDYDVPMEKEKKRRNTPPPPARPPLMQNGQYVQGHAQQPPLGQGMYNGGYGQAPQMGQPPFNPGQQQANGPYYSPYAQPGQPGYAPAGPSGAPQGQQASQPAGYPPNAQQQAATQQHHQSNGSAPPAQQQKSANWSTFNGLVDEIMAWRTKFLGRHAMGTAEYRLAEQVFQKCTNTLSDLYHGNREAPEVEAARTDEEKTCIAGLGEIFSRHNKTLGKPAPAQNGNNAAGSAGAGSEVQQAPNSGGEVKQAVGAAVEHGAAVAAASQTNDNVVDLTDTTAAADPPIAEHGGSNEPAASPAPVMQTSGVEMNIAPAESAPKSNAATLPPASAQAAASAGTKRAAEDNASLEEGGPDAKRAKI